jgi:hypothetical protein
MDPYLKEDGVKLSLFDREDWLAIAPETDPVDVEVILNGVRRVFALTECSEQDAFLGSRYTVSGKSLTTYLGEPYILPTSKIFEVNLILAQLIEEILLNTGWTVAVDGYWEEVISGNTYSMNNKTPIAAIKDIADALGLSVRPDPEDQHIELELLYPCTPSVLPGAVKDYVIDAAGIVSMTHTLDRGEQSNGVWVGGQAVGVFDQIVQQGTDGSSQYPMFTNDLIQTHQLAQQKGLELLSYSKRLRKTQIKMPVYTETDIIAPNRKAKVTDSVLGPFSAYTRRVVINGKWANKALQVYQTVELERQD